MCNSAIACVYVLVCVITRKLGRERKKSYTGFSKFSASTAFVIGKIFRLILPIRDTDKDHRITNNGAPTALLLIESYDCNVNF